MNPPIISISDRYSLVASMTSGGVPSSFCSSEQYQFVQGLSPHCFSISNQCYLCQCRQFTGTPIESTDVNTPAVFGNYIDVYDIAQAVEDGATVRIFYESRLAKISLSEAGKKLVADLDATLAQDDLTETQKAKAKWTQLEALIGSENRIRQVARDIIEHFEARQEVFEGKAMVVAMSRRIAADLYNAMVAILPEWHSDDLKKGVIKVVMTSASSDGPEISKHHTTKDQRRMLAERMRDPEDELKMVIVH